MAAEGPKQWEKAAVVPRTLDVRKYAESRAAELDSLHSILSDRLKDDFCSRNNKRRRTTGFKARNRRRPQKPCKFDDDEEKKLPRRVRRRIELKKNPNTGFSVSGDGTRRLRTHVWHAKRFTMAKLWGFYLPLGLHGRGKGSRALLKWCKQGVVVHDASYYSAVQLEGPEDSLLSILSSLLVPCGIDNSENISKFIISGQIYGSAMLHYGRHESSKAICPVTYMWRPSLCQDNGVGVREKGADENTKIESGSHLRRLWIWIHPSAFREGFDCLKLACQSKMDETGVLLDCVSLDGKLGRLEVMGSRASQLLQKILHSCNNTTFPVCSTPKQGILHPCTSSYLEGLLESDGKNGCGSKQNTLKNAEHLSLSTIMLLAVVDPRSLLGKRSAAVPDAHLSSNLCGLSEDKRNDHSAGNMHMKEEELSVLQSAYETDSSLPNCKELWDVVNEVVHPPVEENVLCLDRQKESLDFFCIKDATSAKSMSTETKFSRLCPIMLLRDTNHTGLLTGWSIIVPLNWVKAFWIPLLSGGAHAVGLREKHWIACDVGFPYFPSDFPDCNAYSCFMAREAAEVEKKMECCTLDMRFLKVPIPPPWSSINFGFNKVDGQVNGIDTSSNIRSHEDFSADLDCDIPDAGPVNNSGSGCELLVARTSGMLASFLKEVSGDHLLLFPKTPDRMSFSHLMKDEAKFSQASKAATLTSYGRRLCYLRVLLHAYKEGVFDEGAVVCAPRFADLSLWTSRSLNNEVGLQVPHCFLGSYFKQLSSGEWEFQLPADPAAIEAYRQPIGFVTTGFVRGSKRPVAVGFCEAVLLAHLRQEQWSQMPAKQRRKEIYVLVRNLRSTAYRLALASIILEEQQEDVKSL